MMHSFWIKIMIKARDLNNQNNESPKYNKDEKEDNIGEVIKISEELDKPNELNKDSTDNDYIKIINDKMKKYKRELTKSTKSNTIKKNKLNKKKNSIILSKLLILQIKL